ncbi:MAG TPA: hypothetical protein VE263_13440 [Candidatus Angelobacter sp.]|nr:hypothetical protein [Candidatus Angelobacter sp.]
MTGKLTYALDDTYITMALAKNLALHGVMGISATRFVSATSCPGFLLLLSAAYRLTGPTDWWPMLLAIGFGILSIVAASRLMKGAGLLTQVLALCGLVVFAPLHVMGLLGMEHTLHIALTLAFLNLVGRGLEEGEFPSWGLLALAGMMVSVRYESLLLIAPACLLYLQQRRLKAAIFLGSAAAIPVVVYGIVATTLHSYWLSQSISLKGLSGEAATHSPVALIDHFASNLSRAPYLGVFLAILAVTVTLPSVRSNKRSFSMLIIVLSSILLHLALADVGWAYRYEAYLVASAIVVIAFSVSQVRRSESQWATLPAIVVLLVLGASGAYFLSVRTLEANRTLPYRSLAVYSQQIQMARFLHRFEEGAAVAANDVGAISFYTGIDCLDLVGLADREVFALKQKKAYSTEAIAKLAAERQVKVALVYDTWFSKVPLTGLGGLAGPTLPPSWIRVARWRTPYGQYLGGDTVSFYATNPEEAARLRSNLATFAPSLPPSVRVLDD